MRNAIIRDTILSASFLFLAVAPVSPVSADEASPAASAQVIEALAAAPAAPAPAVSPNLEAEAAALRPGEFVWRPELAAQGAVELVVSIPLQRAYVYRGGVLIGVTTVSTGRSGHPTPTGTFPITQKRRQHFSNLYANAPMPFMQRLTNDGIALHAGHIPGHPASHGCVRLPLAFARALFEATSVGTSVHITDRSHAPAEALAMIRGRDSYRGMGGPIEAAGGAR